ncbi:hypothetical protein TRVL_09714 [Trypanosoma vivax]|nr:hypothetical protein TRVL_09714 [Trypanosoma vivax]
MLCQALGNAAALGRFVSECLSAALPLLRRGPHRSPFLPSRARISRSAQRGSAQIRNPRTPKRAKRCVAGVLAVLKLENSVRAGVGRKHAQAALIAKRENRLIHRIRKQPIASHTAMYHGENGGNKRPLLELTAARR